MTHAAETGADSQTVPSCWYRNSQFLSEKSRNREKFKDGQWIAGWEQGGREIIGNLPAGEWLFYITNGVEIAVTSNGFLRSS